MNNITYTVLETHPHSLDIHDFFKSLSNPQGIVADHIVEPTEWAGIAYVVPTTNIHAEEIYNFMSRLKQGTGLFITVDTDSENTPSEIPAEETITIEDRIGIPELPKGSMDKKKSTVPLMDDQITVEVRIDGVYVKGRGIDLKVRPDNIRIETDPGKLTSLGSLLETYELSTY